MRVARIVDNPASRATRVRCDACGGWAPLPDMLTDLDGGAFKAYYHADAERCAGESITRVTLGAVARAAYRRWLSKGQP